MDTYKDALFQLNTGFFVIGLTGYTGSGCSSAAKILKSSSKPELPSYEAIKSESPSSMEERIYKKLQKEWAALNWESFQLIEVSKVIFMLALRESLSKSGGEDIQILKNLLSDDDKKYIKSGVDSLVNAKFLNEDKSRKIIKAYEIASSKYGVFKSTASLELGEFIQKMQDYGDNVRKYKSIKKHDKSLPENLYYIPRIIRKITKSYRISIGKTRFVIDAFRNPYEIEFFRKRYSEFYLVGINRDSVSINEALRELPPNHFKSLSERERGEKISKKGSDNIAEWITSQNVTECLRKSDVYIDNKSGSKNDLFHLKYGLIKLITLALSPGCIPPTQDERCMQTASVAAQMSGCISRKVGAVVLDKSSYVVGVGWNSTPHQQIPCLLRTVGELKSGSGREVFSDYERSDDFKAHIASTSTPDDEPFCFRSELAMKTGKIQAEYTRALHAEENALFQASSHAGLDLSGATLYTTASTCNLCAKKAYQLGIKRIVFIDDYPGISIEQTLEAGSHRIVNSRFEGITSFSYLKLFVPHMSQKDLIKIYS